MSIKKILILFVTAFMVFSLAACESSKGKEPKILSRTKRSQCQMIDLRQQKWKESSL